ncbi:MAG: FMN-binding protein [Longicatena sp.]
MKKLIVWIGCSILLFGCKSATAKVGNGTHKNANGEVVSAKVTLKDDKISEVSLDESAKDKDKTKKELGSAYNMKQASPIKKEWNEQVDFFEKYVSKHGIDSISLNAEGKANNPDVKSGCTISVDGFIKAIEDAKKNAK